VHFHFYRWFNAGIVTRLSHVWRKASSGEESNYNEYVLQEYWKNAFLRLALMKLTKRQKKILVELYLNCNGDVTLTSLARELSEKLRLPESTVKWNLRLLRDAGLIQAGSFREKNVPVRLSRAGLVLAEKLARLKFC